MNLISNITYTCILISLLSAQLNWEENGVAVRQGYHIEWQRTADVGANGEVIFAWSDTRDGGRDIYAMKIDTNGNVVNGWDVNGQIVVKAPGRQEDPQLVTDGNGGAYVIWKDYRDEPDDGDFYAQHILSNGSLSWNEMGVPLTTVSGKQSSPNLCIDGMGGAFAIWKDESLGSGVPDLYGTHLGPNESDVIAPGIGVLLNSTDLSYGGVSLEVSSAGSAMLVWSYSIGLNNEDLFAQRIDINCNTLWSSPEDGGIVIYEGEGVQESPRVTHYNEDYSIIVWEDDRLGDDDIYAQFINMSGDLMYPSGLLVTSADDRQYQPRVKADSDGAYVIWSDLRDNNGTTPVNNDIYIQRITIQGGLAWPEEVPIAQTDEFLGLSYSPDHSEARLTVEQGMAFVVWMDDSVEEGEYDISIQHVMNNGEVLLDSDHTTSIVNGYKISSAEKRQENPIVRPNVGSTGAFVIWGDKRFGSIGIYAQYIEDGNIFLDANGKEFFWGIDGNTVSSYATKPNSLYIGNDQVVISWTDQRFGQNLKNFGQKIYDGWTNIEIPDGYKLSDSQAQDYPILKNVGNDIIHIFPDISSDVKLKYQLLDQNLNFSGDSEGNLVNPSSDYPQFYNSFIFENLSDGNSFLAFSELEFFAAFNIFVQKFDSSGIPVFSNPISVTSDFVADENVRGVYDIPGEGLIIIYDSESGITGSRVKAIAVNYEGNILSGWEGGISVCNVEEKQTYLGSVNITSGETNAVFVIWNDGRGDGDDIFGQMIDINGNLLGSSDGIPIAYYDSYQQNPSIVYNEELNEILICWDDYIQGSYYDISCRSIHIDNIVLNDIFKVADIISTNQINSNVFSTKDGNYLVVWQDSRNFSGTVAPNDDIYIQQITNGGVIFEENGLLVCDADFSQTYPQIELYNEMDDSYIIYWNDLRSSGKDYLFNIYAQSISISSGTQCTLGDINVDGIINVIDIVSLVNYILGTGDFDSNQLCAADLNSDTIINVIDIVALVNLILSL